MPDQTPLSPAMTARLLELARQVQRLTPSHRHPERFHENKSEVVAALRQLANASERDHA